jgi:hypothetical protein
VHKKGLRRQAERERIEVENAAREACSDCRDYESGECPSHPKTERRTPGPKTWTCGELLRSAEDTDTDETKICGRTERCFDCCAKLGITSGAAERARQSGTPWLLSPDTVAALLSLTKTCKRCHIPLVLGSTPPRDDSPAIYRIDATLPYALSNVMLGCVRCVSEMSLEQPR